MADKLELLLAERIYQELTRPGELQPFEYNGFPISIADLQGLQAEIDEDLAPLVGVNWMTKKEIKSIHCHLLAKRIIGSTVKKA
ncbi:hypothetical protein [Candidatus Chlorohelix sp.]|uniref:hypothetical protein n=1 Tax=Candidatus Chlorohelix sp. TaxID=3139201 RepID=UPI00306AB7AB